MKKMIPALLALSCSLLAGCSAAPVPVTEDNAPTEIMKTLAGLNSESEAADVQAAYDKIVQATAAAYEYQIALDQSIDANNMDLDEEGKLISKNAKTEVYDVRYAADTRAYEIYEQSSDEGKTAGFMESGKDGSATVFADFDDKGKVGDLKSELTVSSVQVQDAQDSSDTSDEELKTIIQNTVAYPLYLFAGQNLILSPASTPEHYTFALTKRGNEYTLSMKIKDQEEYNAALDTFVQENYGTERKDVKGDGTLMVDVYDTTEVTIEMTMDENGVLSKVVNKNINKIGDEDKPLNIYNNQTTTITKAPESLGSFFTDFFAGVRDGSIKEGDKFSILSDEKAASKDDANKEDAAADDASKEDASKDDSSKEDASKEESKSDADAKADDSKDKEETK